MMVSSLINLILNSQELSGFLIGGMSKLLARICRIGQNELKEIKQVSSTLESLLPSNPNLLFPVLQVLLRNNIRDQQPVKGRPLSSNPKIAVSLRDEELGKIFNIAYLLLTTTSIFPVNLLSSLLHLLHLCLNFDFLGVSSDETCEDSVCLQIPLQWKNN